ncbi:MAG: hypothetical protein M3Q23_17965 [Actinomycetota bacterium]|nr:hypothetical protein [Actinomycetota bacterium]
MARSEQENISQAIQDNAPTAEAELVSWGLVAEWRLPDGQRFLSRMGGPESTLWQMKGYLNEGVYGQWLPNALPGAWEGN